MATLVSFTGHRRRCRTVPCRIFASRGTGDQRTRAGSVQRDDDGPRPGQSDLLAGVPDAVYRLDRDGRMTYVNAAAEALLERRADELIGRHALENFPTSRGTVAETHIREVLADRQPRQFAYYYEPQERWY